MEILAGGHILRILSSFPAGQNIILDRQLEVFTLQGKIERCRIDADPHSSIYLFVTTDI